MKTLRMMRLALIAILLCVSFAQCNNEEKADLTTPKICTVGVHIKNICKVEESPLGRSGSENNDLYLVWVYDKAASKNYAYGLFDDLTDISVNLMENKEYNINATAVKNGKNLIYKTGSNFYAPPFKCILNNQFIYCQANDSWSVDLNNHILASGDGDTPEEFAPIEQYAGVNTLTATDNATIELSLSRYRAFGVKFIADDMPEGKLEVTLSTTVASTTHSSEPFYVMGEGASNAIEKVYTMGASIYSQSGIESTLTFKWIKGGNSIDIPSASITFKEGLRYIITVKVDNTSDLQINITEDDKFINGDETYYIDNGIVTEQ